MKWEQNHAVEVHIFYDGQHTTQLAVYIVNPIDLV